MKRISLNERLGEKSNRDVVRLFAGLTVFEYIRGTQEPGGSEKSMVARFCFLLRRLKAADLGLHPAMCHTVMEVVMSGFAGAEEILYELLIEPIYRIQMEKEEMRHDHSLCAEGDSGGPDQDDHGGREFQTP